MHYLRWCWPITAYGWSKAGFDYDSTLTYANNPGFRCGTCHPFQMFDPLKKSKIGIKQKPLILMESSLIHKQYLGLGYTKKSFEYISKLKELVKK